MKNTTDIVTGLLTLGVSALGAMGMAMTGAPSLDAQVGPTSFTKAIVIGLFLLGCAQTWTGFHTRRKISYWPSPLILKKVFFFIILFLSYACLVILLSSLFKSTGINWLADNVAFCVATFMFLVASMLVGGRKNILEIGLVAILVPVVITLIFSYFFLITLP